MATRITCDHCGSDIAYDVNKQKAKPYTLQAFSHYRAGGAGYAVPDVLLRVDLCERCMNTALSFIKHGQKAFLSEEQ